jgi:hypothetical protein
VVEFDIGPSLARRICVSSPGAAAIFRYHAAEHGDYEPLSVVVRVGDALEVNAPLVWDACAAPALAGLHPETMSGDGSPVVCHCGISSPMHLTNTDQAPANDRMAFS